MLKIDNNIANHGFEANKLTPWRVSNGNGTVWCDPSKSHEKKCFAAVSSKDGKNLPTLFIIKEAPLMDYGIKFGVWARTSVPKANRAIQLFAWNLGSNKAIGSSKAMMLNHVWRYYEMTVNKPEENGFRSTPRFKFEIILHGTKSRTDTYYDNITLVAFDKKSSSPNPIILPAQGVTTTSNGCGDPDATYTCFNNPSFMSKGCIEVKIKNSNYCRRVPDGK